MSMNELLANYYGTNGSGQAEELEKQAQVELFAKLASDNGIDLNELNDDQVQGLWDSTFKTAGDEEDEDKKEKAKAEFAEKKEASDKLAEADFLGRTMAHAYVDELNKIAGKTPEPGMVSKAWEATKHHLGDAAKGTSVREGLAKRKALSGFAGSPGLDKVRSEANSEIAKGVGKTVGLYGAGGLAVKKTYDAATDKHGSALDQVAAELAVEKAAEAGFDANEAAQRVDALLTLGAGESEKVAAASDYNEAIDVRSLELLEGAGYPIQWSKEATVRETASRVGDAAGRFAKKVTGYSDIRGGLKGRRTAERSLVGSGVSGPVREGGKRVADKNTATAGKYHATKRLAKGVGKATLTAGATSLAANEAHKRASAEEQDELLFDLAVEKAASAGFDVGEAEQRIAAVMTLGLEDSEKVAAAQDIEGAFEIRSLEVLEAAGYPIEWA